MLAERRKTGGDNSDTASLLSISSHRSDRRRTGECYLEGDPYMKEKRSTIDRMRRKTTDNVLSSASTSSVNSGNMTAAGSAKSKFNC